MRDVRCPRPVYCPTWHLHRNMAVARDICAGQFTLAGTTITIRGEPDWTRGDLRAVEDWWAEWIEFPYALDLAFAFEKTGDPVYLHKWTRLVGSWAAEVSPDFGPIDAIGPRIQNWLYAWVALEQSGSCFQMEPIVRDTIAESIMRQAQYLQAHMARDGYRRTVHLSALLVVALALPDAPGADRLRQSAWLGLQRSVLADFEGDARHRQHPAYQAAMALRSRLALPENARRFDLPLDVAFEHRLKVFADFSLQCAIDQAALAVTQARWRH